MDASTTAPTSRIDFSQPVDISQLFPAIEQALLERGIDVEEIKNPSRGISCEGAYSNTFGWTRVGGGNLFERANHRKLGHYHMGGTVEIRYEVFAKPSDESGRFKEDYPEIQKAKIELVEWRGGSLNRIEIDYQRGANSGKICQGCYSDGNVVSQQLVSSIKRYSNDFGKVVQLFADAFASTYQKKKEPAVSRAV
ncbi:hypothetical protein HYU13_01155 [Candidatus Woesearchaeota archaeon]|nr:hypothetical protein [Candidatus Woesearchaeota archaeon]